MSDADLANLVRTLESTLVALYDALRVAVELDVVGGRADLLLAYKGRCAITGCDVAPVLDAAHIQPYRGAHTNITPNGLLLRADVHALFDLGLLAIDPDDGTGLVSTQLNGTDYERLRGTTAAVPSNTADRPTAEILSAHLDWCGDRLTPPAPTT